MVKNLVFPRIFLHCVSLPDVVSGLLLSDRSEVRVLSGVPEQLPPTAGAVYFCICMEIHADVSK